MTTNESNECMYAMLLWTKPGANFVIILVITSVGNVVNMRGGILCCRPEWFNLAQTEYSDQMSPATHAESYRSNRFPLTSQSKTSRHLLVFRSKIYRSSHPSIAASYIKRGSNRPWQYRIVPRMIRLSGSEWLYWLKISSN